MAAIERHSFLNQVYATARGRPTTYMKWIIVKYAEILIASGYTHFRQGTLESLPLVTQRYIEAAHVLGPEPPTVPKLEKREAKTYATLEKDEVDFELSLAFACDMVERGSSEAAETDPTKQSLLCFVRTGYFCVPLNPKAKQVRNVIKERLSNVRNSLNSEGSPVVYSVIKPLLDPGALIAADAAGGRSLSEGMTMILGDRDSPMPSYRFESLVRRAIDMCMEKEEAEAFNLLRAHQTMAVQRMALELKELQREEQIKTVESLQLSRDSQAAQLRVYLALVGESLNKVPTETSALDDVAQDFEKPMDDDLKMNSHEWMEMNFSTLAAAINITASAIDSATAPLHAIPRITTLAMPMGVGISIQMDDTNVGNTMSTLSNVLKMGSVMASRGGSALRTHRTADPAGPGEAVPSQRARPRDQDTRQADRDAKDARRGQRQGSRAPTRRDRRRPPDGAVVQDRIHQRAALHLDGALAPGDALTGVQHCHCPGPQGRGRICV